MRPNAFSIKHVVRQLEASLTAKERRVKRRFRSFKLSLGYHPHSQDPNSNSPYSLPYNSYEVTSEILALDQLFPRLIFFYILILCHSWPTHNFKPTRTSPWSEEG